MPDATPSTGRARFLGRCLVSALLLAIAGRAHALSFTDVTAAAGLATTTHGYANEGAWGEPASRIPAR